MSIKVDPPYGTTEDAAETIRQVYGRTRAEVSAPDVRLWWGKRRSNGFPELVNGKHDLAAVIRWFGNQEQ